MRIRTLTVFYVFTLCLLGNNVSGQTSMTDLVNYALKHSRDIKKAELQCKEAEYSYKEVRGQGLPQINATASYSKMMLPDINISPDAYDALSRMADMFINESVSDDDKQGIKDRLKGMLDQFGNLNAMYTSSAGVQITQLIYSQSYLAGLKAAKKVQELYSILKSNSEEEVIAEVSSGYYQAGSLMLQLQTVDKSLNNLKEIHRMAELSYQNDLVKESSVNRLKVTITNLEVTRQTIRNGIDIQLNYLKALAGMPGDTLLAIDTTRLISDFVANSPVNGFDALNVPSYRALIKQDEIYDQQVRLSKATFLPTIAAYGNLSYSAYNTTGEIRDFSNMNTLGLSFSMPIFTSGVNNAKVNKARIKQFQLRQDILKANDFLTISYNNAYSEYQTAREMLAVQKENRELALKVYSQTSLQYKEGMASMSDLLNVNSDFLQADNSFNQQILKCKIAEINMLKASGNLKSLINNP
ncbi:MAG TPA: TolC family protein [Bacteroidales bacterium]|jgi:outer membrane protein TolC|nr:TolC family protein [Bacteroidales bacterium]